MNKNIEKFKKNQDPILLNIKGLTSEEVEEKIRNNQKNKNKDKFNKSIKDILFFNIFTLFNALLLIITIIIIYIGEWKQLFFLIINSFNVFINIYQEIKTKKTLDKISLLKLNFTKVVRNGALGEVLVENIVTEDILFLELGSQIVADSIIKKGTLEVNESFLTGESKSVFKKEGDFLFSGSYVVSGNAYSKVVKVDSDTYISKLTREAKKYKKIKTPLLRTFDLLIRSIIFILIPIALFLSLFCVFASDQNTFILGICGFVLGMMPIGLFLLTSVTLFVGFVKLINKKAYIKDLYGIEMLARIDVLCLDKTGTITDGAMTVKNILDYNEFNLFSKELMFEIINAFNNNNNSTQNALYEKFCSSFKKQNKINNYEITEIQNFSSEKKYSAVEVKGLGTFLLGAPEFILKQNFDKIQQKFNEQTQLGYRVLLLVQTYTKISDINFDTNYNIISLISLEDTIKKDTFEVIDFFIKNGIQIKIISGDNSDTISHIAKKINIISDDKKVINLTNIKEEELPKIAKDYNVFGRATPIQKKHIIESFKQNNYKVGMIGDGVNDILAFKEADISIAMASGSESSRNVANLILMDSQFSSLTEVFAEGRRVVNNLQKISISFLIKNILFFLLAIITIFYNLFVWAIGKDFLPFPLKPLQFNIFDTFFVGLPSFFLALEANNKKVEKSFVKNILKQTYIYPLIITVFYIFCLLIERNNDKISNFLSLFCSFIFCFVFIQNCRPFNKLKFILVMSVISLFIPIYIFLNLDFIKSLF